MLPTINRKIRKDKMKNGKCPIVFQVYYKGARTQVFPSLSIEPEYWDEETQLASKKYPKHQFFNSLLKQEYEKLEKKYLTQQLETGEIALKTEGKVSKQDFFKYALEMFDGKKNTCKESYISRSKTAIKDFQKFTGPLTFQGVTPQILKKYEDYLFQGGKGEKKARNTVNRIFKRIKQVFTQAVREGITDKNPFNVYRSVTYKQSQRNFLTMDEIKKIEEVNIPEQLESVRNYFLLACYTGLRYSDLAVFDKEKMISHNQGVKRFILGTTKTGEPVSIKMNSKIQKVVDAINKPIPTNVHTNRLLKIICEVAKVKTISIHGGRHSFSVQCASLGFPIEVVARLLGHTNIRTTAIYYKIIDTKVDEFMDRWDGV